MKFDENKVSLCMSGTFSGECFESLSTEKEATVGDICLLPQLADKLWTHFAIGRQRESFMICSAQLYDNKPFYLKDCGCVCVSVHVDVCVDRR